MNLLANAVVLAAAEEASGTDLLIPEISELIAGVIAFSIVFFVVWKFAVPAINQTLENRRQAIKAELDEAEKSKVEAASLLEDYKAQLKGARAEADRIVDEARQAGEAMKADILAKANAEAQEIVTKARTEADTEKDRALQEARADMANLSLDLAERVVGASLDRNAQRELVDAYLADLDGMS